MDVEKYIASGVLELYLTGALSEEENFEVYQHAMEHPKIKEEIWSIEAAIFEVSKSVFPVISRKKGFNDLKDRIGKSEATRLSKKGINWKVYGSRAAAVLMTLGLLWSVSMVSKLKSDMNSLDQQNQELHYQIAAVRDSLVKSNKLLQIIKGENMLVIPLAGQKASPTSTAEVYWNTAEKKIYVDAQGLPDAPEGFVYQLWSLKLDPSTPTSVGLLDGLQETTHNFFVFENTKVYEAEAFWITLEPEGGSETPTLEQLYTKGTVSSSS